MTLDQYLSEAGITEAVFAERIGRSSSFVNRLRNRKTWPLRETLERIHDATNGAVTPNDFLGIAHPSAETAA